MRFPHPPQAGSSECHASSESPKEPPTIDLSICILTNRQPALLSGCVASCIAEIEQAGLDAEIIVVDNASADGHPQRLLGTCRYVRVIRNNKS